MVDMKGQRPPTPASKIGLAVVASCFSLLFVKKKNPFDASCRKDRNCSKALNPKP